MSKEERPLEGELYKLEQHVFNALRKADKYPPVLGELIRYFGLEKVSARMASIVREKFGDEASGMFRMGEDDFGKTLQDCEVSLIKEIPAEKLKIEFEEPKE